MNSQYPCAERTIDVEQEVGRIEDEQCQKVGGGYKAVKFRFLLFL
jgi:hypothetical protein